MSRSGDGWIEHLLAKVSALFLLVKAYERIETLPAATQVDVRTAIGWSLKEEELPEENLVSDEWLVLGQLDTGEEGLRVRRTWLWGERTAKNALILEFAAPGQHLALDLMPGTKTEAELIFYPSNYPQRAALTKRVNTARSFEEIPGYPTSDQLLMTYAGVLARNPWLERIPAPARARFCRSWSKFWASIGHRFFSAISAYLCVLCVNPHHGQTNAEDAEIRRDRREGCWI